MVQAALSASVDVFVSGCCCCPSSPVSSPGSGIIGTAAAAVSVWAANTVAAILVSRACWVSVCCGGAGNPELSLELSVGEGERVGEGSRVTPRRPMSIAGGL